MVKTKPRDPSKPHKTAILSERHGVSDLHRLTNEGLAALIIDAMGIRAYRRDTTLKAESFATVEAVILTEMEGGDS